MSVYLFKDINRYHIEETTLLALPSFNPTHFDSKNIYLRQFFFTRSLRIKQSVSVMLRGDKDLNLLMYAWFFPLLKPFVANLTFSYISFEACVCCSVPVLFNLAVLEVLVAGVCTDIPWQVDIRHIFSGPKNRLFCKLKRDSWLRSTSASDVSFPGNLTLFWLA